MNWFLMCVVIGVVCGIIASDSGLEWWHGALAAAVVVICIGITGDYR